MEDIAVYCSWADVQLCVDTSLPGVLPVEVRSLILHSSGPRYFRALADTGRLQSFADTLFPLYKPLFPELVAQWITTSTLDTLHHNILTLASLARFFPFATYLRQHVEDTAATEQLQTCLNAVGNASAAVSDDDLNLLLLALFRLLSYDRDMLSAAVGPTFFSSLLSHNSLSIRYLAIQCLCLYMHLADALSEKLVEQYIGKDAIPGQWEDRQIDFRVLKLWEEKRWRDLAAWMTRIEERWHSATTASSARSIVLSDLSPATAVVGGVLLPRVGQLENQSSTFILTPTSKGNLRQLGTCLLQTKPVLLTGEAGSGKTSLVHEAARFLNKFSSMITLHLNEQTDAKSLLGVYTSSTDGESFTWQPGVLTKAIQQGRWVLIEDIDRAPAEVMGVLRPILESGELFLANRKERIKPANGFRILATMRLTSRSGHASSARYSWLMNPRLWNVVETTAYGPSEIETLLRARYSAAEPFVPMILKVHHQVCSMYKEDPSFRSLQSRIPSLRDLLVWSRRVVRRLRDQVSTSTSGSVPQATKVDMFKDAVDCYAGYLNNDELHTLIASCIAREMDISPQQIRHTLDEEISVASPRTGETLQIGRNILNKVLGRRSQPCSSPFALTRFALRTLDRISASASYSEPCLLVGETGVGKTTLVQHIANLVGQKLTVVNLSQQSEASDLLGGLKPVTTRSLILPLVEKFNSLFEDTFSTKRNEKFQVAITKAVSRQNWPRLAILWREAIQLASVSLKSSSEPSTPDGSAHANKKRKLATPKYDALRKRWTDFSDSFQNIQVQIEHGDKNHAFAFVEGRLVQAVRDGEWLLLDEINLATPDTLDYIVSLLHNGDDQQPSLLLAEAGNIESVIAHPNFRVFAAMNPATDAGKKDLSPGLRSRFTEIYVHSGDNNLEDLTKIIQTYLGALLDVDKRAAPDLARAYLDLKRLNEEHRLTDGAGEIPHFSIRSLVRCLLYVQKHSASHGLRRAMYEGFAMSFFTVLSRASESLALPVLEQHLLSNIKNRKSFLTQQPKMPSEGDDFVAFRHHAVKKGPLSPDLQPHYIRTPSVERNLLNLARAASMRRFPILLQGPTSAGKTSMVEYLCKLSGNKFVRINNHEHTDLQEYLGSYISDADGKLKYREGVLVDALRQGHWIVLDELNLAPSDVLEALNRLLDDNRELFIPESQEIVHPHPNFMLFATQNPAGLYGGRKRLSRAFRNRFLELHFDDIPEDELEIILKERAQLPPSYCSQIVAVYKKLSLQRQSSRLFEQRNSFATLRDLFRWAARPADDRQQLAYHGFMLLAERVRDTSERNVVKKTIEETMKVTIDENVVYGLSALPASAQSAGNIVWTSAMRRLFVLVSAALKNNEPVLLVGETGCGKTQICQVIAEAFDRPLNIYNAHTNTETGDLIGSQRPVRNRSELASVVRDNWATLINAQNTEADREKFDVDQLVVDFASMDTSGYAPEAVERVRVSIGAYQSLFSWSDGSLVRAMKTGEHFLLDEISLADDSVLERLNSVLEPSRTILLAEKGSVDNLVIANSAFQFLATMNPGGDYGKRELSAALRNRLTEIWVPPLSQEEDVLPIVQNKLESNRRHLAKVMLRFAIWFRSTFHNTSSNFIPLRDLLAWAEFVNRADFLSEKSAFVHGAFMVYIDSIGANPAGMTSAGASDITASRQNCLEYLQFLVGIDVGKIYREIPKLQATNDLLHIGRFSIPRSSKVTETRPDLVFDAPTTLQNTMRIVRALQMKRPILLEGSPGVGKTAIVTALAQASGRLFTRINLSDQTDLMDLFGADVPSENEQMGKFSWRNGPLLNAMQRGGWLLLDEMNLASQSVLEGLNSCLDHRQEVYIAELDKSFTCHPDFTLFAAQNPHHQGGGRKGLPSSFVNRFTVVYADSFKQEDLMRICQRRFPEIPEDKIETVVTTMTEVERATSQASTFSQGAPWELNLRDTNRWLQLCEEQPTLDPLYHFGSIVRERFRTPDQKEIASGISQRISPSLPAESFYTNISPEVIQVGTSLLKRDDMYQHCPGTYSTLPASHLPAVKAVITAINRKWPVILVGSSGSGKTSLIRSIAAFAGAQLTEFSMNADVDTMDFIGGFEQYDVKRLVVDVQKKAKETLRFLSAKSAIGQEIKRFQEHLHRAWQVIASDEVDTSKLASTLAVLGSDFPDFEPYVRKMSNLISGNSTSKSRFVWNDGILVDAVEKGLWLVLDNANLCNPSVLDRLNSLLEPDGGLVVSEQHGSVNGSRVIKPHENFRIFLTMDPRYGELSRAMRNRSLEIFMPTGDQTVKDIELIQYPLASAVSRLRLLSDATSANLSPGVIEASIDNLSADEAATVVAHDLVVPGTEGNEIFSSDVEKRKYFNAGEEVFTMVGFAKVPTRALLPQLLTLNEPWMSIFNAHGKLLAADLLTRTWFMVRRMKAIKVRLELACEQAHAALTKDHTLLEKSVLTTNRKIPFSIPPVWSFANRVIMEVQMAFMENFKNGIDLKLIKMIEGILTFIQALIHLFEAKTLDSPRFAGYLKIGVEMVNSLKTNSDALALSHLAYLFGNALEMLQKDNFLQLRTGFSLQLMWEPFKPVVATTMSQLSAQLTLEELISRFDKACRYLPESRSSLARLRSRLLETYASVLQSEQPLDGLDALQIAVIGLEQQPARRLTIQGKFEEVFDYIYDKVSLEVGSSNSESLQLLAIFSLTARNQLPTCGKRGSASRSLKDLASLNSTVLSEQASTGLHLMGQLTTLNDQPLGLMEHAAEELQQFMVATTSHTVAFEDSLSAVLRNLHLLTTALLRAHYDLLCPEAQECFSSQGLLNVAQLSRIAAKDVVINSEKDGGFRLQYICNIHPFVLVLNDRQNFSLKELKECLVRISIAGLVMMVPGKVFDPAVYSSLAVDLHNRRTSELSARIEGQRQFHTRVMGQQTSLVIRILEQELVDMGDAPSGPMVVRPEKSELSQLQEVFTGIAHMIPHDVRVLDWIDQGTSQQLEVNLRALIERLEKVNRAYDDFVKPITWFAKCLLVGTKINVPELASVGKASTFQEIINHTPLLSPTPEELQAWMAPIKRSTSNSIRFHWLEYVGLCGSLLQVPKFSQSSLLPQGLIGVLDTFYSEWKSRLARDQAEAVVHSRYYSYRGDGEYNEDLEQQELQQMFPQFDHAISDSQHMGKKYDGRATATKLACLHQKIYSPDQRQAAIETYLRRTFEVLSHTPTAEIKSSSLSFIELLPVMLLHMENKAAEFRGTSKPAAISIYTDSDMDESRKLFNLVQQIRARFFEIQERWPEHAVPADAIAVCDDIMHLNISEPIAKLLAGTEKLFEIVSQWQSVASREWSVASLIDHLTSLIISWRRLELLSWSRLLDEEKKKHEEDAQLWYFIAYEAVVYNTIRIEAEGDSVKSYCRDLARTLEEFFRTTTLGQYSSRLTLLDTLGKTLYDVACNEQHLLPLSGCVSNVIEHYRRYETAVATSLQSGRVELEKALKEQIQLASWKDTNVTALRDSARRSHLKLFRIVKKYRALLNQPVTAFKASNDTPAEYQLIQALSKSAKVQYDAAKIERANETCVSSLSDWTSRPQRLIDPLGAVKSMQHLFDTTVSDFEAQHEIASFREDLVSGIKELRAQTPATATEDNTSLVRHLHERKRRLLAETLKSVIHMGIRRNLPTSELEKQSSTAIVLASSHFDSRQLLIDPAASEGFHELLDAMVTARAARAEHSDDLTEGETNRSLGLLEGLLSVTLNQRQNLGLALKHLDALHGNLALLRALGEHSSNELSHSVNVEDQGTRMSQHLAWFTEMLRLSCRVLSFQAQHAKFDVAEVLHKLETYGDLFAELRSNLDSLAQLPSGLTSQPAKALHTQCVDQLSQLGELLTLWLDREPRIGFVLRKLVPWTEGAPITRNGTQNGFRSVRLQDFDEHLRYLTDKIFVALQRLPSIQEAMPKSIEDQGWLSNFDKYSFQTIQAMHTDTISVAVRDLLEELHCLASGELEVAISLIMVASPIIEQYYSIYEDLCRRQAAIHMETCRLAIQLTKSFTILANEGFCRPSDPATSEEQSGKLESGTGLGEGEGAEDISKDVGDDEDLSELAQSGQKEEQDGGMDNAEDAVDMGNDELQGETGDYEEQKSNDEDDGDRSDGEEGEDIDEETGSVDDLDPSAVDEKMWDDMKKESEKDKELKNDKGNGRNSDDQTTAEGEKAEGEDMEGVEGEEEIEEEDDDEVEGTERPEAENMDPHPEDGKTLDLPEELDFAGDDEAKDDNISDDGMDDLSDVERSVDEAAQAEEEEMDHRDNPLEDASTKDEGEADNGDHKGTAQDDEIMDDQPDEPAEDERDTHDTREGEEPHDIDEPAGGDTGAANELQDITEQDQNIQGMNKSEKELDPQQARPGKAPENEEQGDTGKGAAERGVGRMDTIERQPNEALRRLADVLEQWHQRREILPASEEQQQRLEEDGKDVDMADVDFEHVEDDDAGDTQALGAAAADQAQNLDQSKAIEDNDMPVNEDTDITDVLEASEQENIADRFTRVQAQQNQGQVQETGAFIPSSNQNRAERSPQREDADAMSDDLSPEIEHLDISQQNQMDLLPLTSSSDAAQLWNHCSTTTHQFSLVLTEQLRLILSPTTATKLRGDFRTGKRLNLKRIIPYIASGYKRDKIWMRRSVPSKRNYQIMIAVDDSKSMAESGADVLAFETLALLTKSLSMLEAGELCVVGFGDEEHIRVAHSFGTPFSPAESGVGIFQSFSFQQKGTNVRNLVRESIQLFRDARVKGHSASEDLWQLQLILSDGHCSDHAAIARLVRQAQQEKIIIVFVIVDAGEESILDLKEAVFEQDPAAVGDGVGATEMRVRTKRYLEDFPFPYYLVVRDVRDLPGVLATALKGWFGSVVDVQG